MVRGILLFDVFEVGWPPACYVAKASPECAVFLCDRHALSHQTCVWGADGGLCTGKHRSYRAVTSALGVCFYMTRFLSSEGSQQGLDKHGCYLSRGGLQQPGQGGEDREEQQGLFAAKIFLFTAQQVQQGPLQKEWMDTDGSRHFVPEKRHLPRKPHGWNRRIQS